MDETAQSETFLTDKELRKRWKCSQMKLWRLRQMGKLHTVKIGGVGVNLTPASNVRQLENARRVTEPTEA
jgi:hypothetical protein